MKLKFLRWLIVDESDRLFEVVEGQERCFRNQLATVYKACDGKFTHRAFFSATFSYEVEEWLASDWCFHSIVAKFMCLLQV
ncbi:hypothetical protein ANCDUO_24287 [Ancylostoma duodenale]|uniref:Uncharacterized protein n=1 Tax=Ancylostoma duodenale TaxID=51022 RepID=A0A0C2FLE0_9BILA|nr:hypothetical protein ANCDUO_24287 [Ancylostoma duodenale]